MTVNLGKWTLALGLLALAILLFVSLITNVVAAPPVETVTSATLRAAREADNASVGYAVLLGGAGLLAMALVAQAEHWR